MNRSTNMEHVRVLYRMANELWRGSPEFAALTAAIAALSAPQPAAVDGAARRRDVRLWMRHNADSYSTATELAEAADEVFSLPDGGLDNETHWVWDEALEAFEAAQQGVEVHELRLCESSRLFLRPDRLYRFTVDPDCSMCREAASYYAQPGGSDNE